MVVVDLHWQCRKFTHCRICDKSSTFPCQYQDGSDYEGDKLQYIYLNALLLSTGHESDP